MLSPKSKFEYALLLYQAGIQIPSDAKVEDLKKLYEEITPDLSLFENYRKLLTYYCKQEKKKNLFEAFSKAELISYFCYKTGHNFPFLTNFLSTHYRAEVASYYGVYGYEVSLSLPKPNPDQQQVIEDRGLTVVNSSAGTGKSSCAIFKAFSLEGKVIMVSYTNAAVNELYDRMITLPDSYRKVGKKCGSQIWCTTIDKIAAVILGKGDMAGTYDDSIIEAIKKLGSRNKLLEYSHIIIDEAQDIDEIRYQLLSKLYSLIKTEDKSLTCFGDPRQRIINNRGLWYEHMWRHEDDIVKRRNITITHRLSGAILSLVNKLSKERPHLHVELVTTNTYETQIEGFVCPDDEDIASIGVHIQKLIENGAAYKDIAFLSPSLNGENATSKYGLRIMAVLKSMGIPTYTKSEGAYRPNAVIFSTIHAAKGKEYDHVFLMGMDDYPASFPHVEYSVAQSIIFVANSRAKKTLTYVFRQKAIFPDGVTEKKVIPQPAAVSNGYQNRCFSLTGEILGDINFRTFMDTNDIAPIANVIGILPHTFPKCPDGLTTRFWGVVCHLIVSVYLTHSYPELLQKVALGKVVYLSQGEVRKLTGARHHGVYSGDETYEQGTIILRSDINCLRESELEQCKRILRKDPLTLSHKELLELSLYYDIVTNDNACSRYDEDLGIEFEFPIEIIEDLRKLLGDNIVAEPQCEYVWDRPRIVGAPDLVSLQVVLEMKTGEITWNGIFQTCIYALMTSKTPFVVNLISGEVYSVSYNPALIRYMVDAFLQLKIHQLIVEERVTFYRKSGTELPLYEANTFSVDTEFDRDGNIFDISLINLNSPFESIVCPMNVPDIKGAAEWLKRDPSLFERDFERMEELFLRLLRKNVTPPTFIYYHCKVDYEWYIRKRHVVDAAKLAIEAANAYGYLTGGAPPKCSEIFQVVCHPLELRPYLSPHTSVSDALMVYEMMRTGFLV